MKSKDLYQLSEFEKVVERVVSKKFEEFKTSLLKELMSKQLGISQKTEIQMRESDIKYLKAGDAAKLLNVSTRTLQRWRKSCDIPHITRRGLAYYSQKDIMAILSGELKISRVSEETVPEVNTRRGRRSSFGSL